MSTASALPQDHPPAEHVLRDLRLGSDSGAEPDLSVRFLAIGRQGPLRTSARILRADGDALLLRVESRDVGAGDRLCTIATATVAKW